MNNLLKGLFFCLSVYALSLQANSLKGALQGLVDTLPSGTVYSGLVYDMDTEQVIFDNGADFNLVPASILKFLTAVTALDVLGAEYRYKTQLRVLKRPVKGVLSDGLGIVFSGDPSLRRQDLKQLILSLKRMGIKKITGPLRLDMGSFRGYERAQGVSWDDLNICYAAPSSGGILDGNCFSATLYPDKKAGNPAALKYDHPEWHLKVDNRVLTENTNNKVCSLRVYPSSRYEYRLIGCISKESSPKRLSLAVNDPQRAVRRFVLGVLRQEGIALQGEVQIGALPELWSVVLSEHHSEPLTVLLQSVLERSDNLYADSLLKILGEQVGSVHLKKTDISSFDRGIMTVRQVLSDKGVQLGVARLVDGSGLSRYNYISARAMGGVLMAAWRQWGEKMPWLQGRVNREFWYKTGTMSGISSMAGYIFPEGRKTPLVFAMILNGVAPQMTASYQEMRRFRQSLKQFYHRLINTVSGSYQVLAKVEKE
ncbi:D-alanyl-D-alanine carboxypeptidase DacB [invertebrate metagenome]|uniref:D-alanyl-D-alanine carboxypeptidase DacB n=1 Tax=invertebrate metagenome TaxID=1711999 RepID=A0A2H9T5F9_9ZZZZ